MNWDDFAFLTRFPATIKDWLLWLSTTTFLLGGIASGVSNLFATDDDSKHGDPTNGKSARQRWKRKRYTPAGVVSLAIAAALFIASGVSGALTHVEGLREARAAEEESARLVAERLAKEREESEWRDRTEALAQGISARVDKQLGASEKTLQGMLDGFARQQRELARTNEAISTARLAQMTPIGLPSAYFELKYDCAGRAHPEVCRNPRKLDIVEIRLPDGTLKSSQGAWVWPPKLKMSPGAALRVCVLPPEKFERYAKTISRPDECPLWFDVAARKVGYPTKGTDGEDPVTRMTYLPDENGVVLMARFVPATAANFAPDGTIPSMFDLRGKYLVLYGLNEELYGSALSEVWIANSAGNKMRASDCEKWTTDGYPGGGLVRGFTPAVISPAADLLSEDSNSRNYLYRCRFSTDARLQ